MNILVTDKGHAVITDLGSARLLDPSRTNKEGGNRPLPRPKADSRSAMVAGLPTTVGGGWTTRWASPEVLYQGQRPDEKSDMWAFGWVIHEVS